MLGTVVNAAAVLAGGTVGLFIKKGMKEGLSDSCMKSTGLATLVIGIVNLLPAMLTFESGAFDTRGSLLLVISLVLGTMIGELLRLEYLVERLSQKLENRFGIAGFTKGFISASLLFCVGAMAIIGSFNDGLYADRSTLYIKSMIDGLSALFLASSLGAGVLFSAIPLFLYQGALTLGASALAPILSQGAMSDMSMVGYAIIMAIGLNLTGATKFKTTNMVPAMIVVLLARLIPWI